MYELFVFILINKGISSRAYNGGVRGKGGKSIVKKISKKYLVMLSILKFIPDRRSSNKA